MNEIRANLVVLDSAVHLIHNNSKHFASLGRYSVKSIKMAVDSLAADTFVVEYRTTSDPKIRENDRKKFTKRVELLGPLYTRSAWRNRVINGNVFENVFECIVSKINVEA